MGRPATSVGAAAGRVSVWRRDSGARHGCTVAKRIPATCMVVVRGLRPLSVRCERRATAHYFVEHHRRYLKGSADFNRVSPTLASHIVSTLAVKVSTSPRVVDRAAKPALALRWERLHIVATASVAEQSASDKRRERPNIAVTASSSAAREGQIVDRVERRSCERRGSRTIRKRDMQHVGFDGLR